MKVGGQRLLVVPPELAYGSRGKPPLVPPNSTVEFAVSLLSVRRSGTNPNSVINMVCGAGRWRPRLGVLYCVIEAMHGGDGEGDVCATCERVPRVVVWGTGVGRLVLSGTGCVKDNHHSPCLWCAACLDRSVGASCTRPAVLMCRVRKCIEAPLAAGSARLFCSESAPCVHWQACCMDFPSFFLLFIACGLLWYVLLSLESRLGKQQLYRLLLEHTSTGDTCVYVLLSSGWGQDAVRTYSARTTRAPEKHMETAGASRSQSRQLWACNKGAKGEIKQLGDRGAAQNKEEIEQCSAGEPANRRYGRGLRTPCAIQGRHPQGVAVAQPQQAVQPSLRASGGQRYLVCPSASAPPDTAQAARPPAVRNASAEEPPANNSTMDRKLRRQREDHIKERPVVSAKHTDAPPEMKPRNDV